MAVFPREVHADTGSFQVRIEPPAVLGVNGATWEYRSLPWFGNPGSWNGSYVSDQVITVDAGTCSWFGCWGKRYEIRFKQNVSGYTAPQNITFTIYPGNLVLFTGVYQGNTTTSTTTSTSTTTTSTSTSSSSSTSTTTTVTTTIITTTVPTSTTIPGSECLEISGTPLEAQFQAAPATLVFALDDSISMKFEILIEESDYNGAFKVGSTYYAYVFDDGQNVMAGGITAYRPAEYWQTQWHGVNRTYYNPRTTYSPWPGKADASASTPLSNPGLSAHTFTLADTYLSVGSISIKNAHYYIKDGSGDVFLVSFNSAVRRYYRYADSDGDNQIDSGELTLLASKPASLNGIVPDVDSADLQNFANWFSYYRRRETSAKNAVARAIKGIEGVRIGFKYISQYATHGLSVSLKKVNVTMEGVLEDESNTLLDSLYAMDSRSSVGTTVRGGLKCTGEYLASGTPYYSDELGGACQQSFAIVVTDGYWNAQDSTFVTVGDQDNDGEDNTLADVAMKYYQTDLSPVLDDLVPIHSGDFASYQHMVTYALAFGVTGNLPQDALPNAWPAPEADEPSTIDDLWHATVNGKGRFMSAASPDELTVALQLLMQNIESRLGSGASVSINGEKITEQSRLFQASFKSDDWHGDVKAFGIDAQTGEVADQENAYIWSAGGKLENRDWNTGREIAAFNGTRGIPFRWVISGDERLSAVQQTQLTQSQLHYLRGDGSGEADVGGVFRNRNFKLGDIVHSIPVFYENVIYVGANDGMLHAFSASDGEELFAYVPNLVFDRLHHLCSTEYVHKFYVDNSPYVSSTGSQTLLAGGLGKGGKGYFCLDVSNPQDNTEAESENWVLWEYPKNGTPQSEIDDMGYSFSRAFIVNTRVGWVVVFGNGYVSSNGRAVLFIVKAADGTLIKKLDTQSGDCNGLSTPAVVDIDNDYIADYIYAGDLKGNLWKFDITGATASAWGFAYNDESGPRPLFQAKDGSGNPQPITVKPDVMFHCKSDKPGLMVLFGTGQYLGNSDFNNTRTQTLYGIWDYGDDEDEYLGSFDREATPRLSNQLQADLLAQTVIYSGKPGSGYTYELLVLSDNEPDWTTVPDPDTPGGDPDPAVHAGWYFDLPVSGERAVRNGMIRDEKLILISLIPKNSPCSAGGDSVLYEMNACTGGRMKKPQFDSNGDGKVDINDMITITVQVPDPDHPGQTKSAEINVPPSAIKYPFPTFEPSIGETDESEVKLINTATGKVQPLKEKKESRGIYNWREVE